MSAVVVPPFRWEGGRVGKCYNNVHEMVRRHGGQPVYGWALADFGPFRSTGLSPPPLYRRWLNHVVWRDEQGQLWEVSPSLNLDNLKETHFLQTDFLPDPQATFNVVSDEEWYTRASRYVPVRPEGEEVAKLLTEAQAAVKEARLYWINKALAALNRAGFRPREWKVETIREKAGTRTGSIWLVAD